MKIESIRLENEFFMNIEIVRVVELIMKRWSCFCTVFLQCWDEAVLLGNFDESFSLLFVKVSLGIHSETTRDIKILGINIFTKLL